MKVIGITGGVGSGKSAVLAWMEQEYGACICQMDEVAKQLQKKGTECFKKIVDEFGDAVVGEDGELDRKELGKMVFSSAEKLQCLNAIVHPAVLKWVQKDIVEKRKQGKPLYVVEAALLTDTGRELCDEMIENGFGEVVDEMWYIYTSENIRRQRLKASRHYTDEKITDMIASQPSEDTFRQACQAVIDNSGDFEDTKRQIGDKL